MPGVGSAASRSRLELRTMGVVGHVWNPGSLSGSAPMSPPPCTLFWPRAGTSPEPQRPMWPGEQCQIAQREDVVDGVVMLGDPEGPQELRLPARGVRVRNLADRVRRDPGDLGGDVERVRLDRLANAAYPSVEWAMKSRFVSPAWMISRAIAFARAMSVPTSMPSQRSANFDDDVRRGSTQYIRAPLSRPFIRWWKKIGCASRAFDPHSRITSAFSISS